MQATATRPQPLLAPAVRAAVALPVALVLAAVVSVATAASHQAVDHMIGQLQDASRAQADSVLVMARPDARAASAGCTAARPEAG